MGDRANITFKTGPQEIDRVWLYSHWGGYSLPHELQQALASDTARGRWSDPPYLVRIVLQSILPEKCDGLGWGISHSMADNEHPILEVDIPEQRVRLLPFDREGWDAAWDAEPLGDWSFAEFCELAPDDGLSMYSLEELAGT